MSVLCVFDRARYLACLHFTRYFGHLFDIVFKRCVLVENEQGGERLRHARRWNDCTGLFGNIGTALRSHDDVLVVRKDDDRIGIDAIDRIEQFLRGRIHGLTTRNDHINTKALKDSSIA